MRRCSTTDRYASAVSRWPAPIFRRSKIRPDFTAAYLYAAVIRGCTHSVIEVNPRHVAYYRRAFAFEPIGESASTRVNAPAVLLCAPFSTIATGLAKYAGKPDVPGAGRSLFLFLAENEVGVLRRLRDLMAAS